MYWRFSVSIGKLCFIRNFHFYSIPLCSFDVFQKLKRNLNLKYLAMFSINALKFLNKFFLIIFFLIKILITQFFSMIIFFLFFFVKKCTFLNNNITNIKYKFSIGNPCRSALVVGKGVRKIADYHFRLKKTVPLRTFPVEK